MADAFCGLVMPSSLTVYRTRGEDLISVAVKPEPLEAREGVDSKRKSSLRMDGGWARGDVIEVL